jgi:hypothetical protein
MSDRNSYKKWTSEDDELLRNLALANVSPFDIAAKLGRSDPLLRRGLIVLE